MIIRINNFLSCSVMALIACLFSPALSSPSPLSRIPASSQASKFRGDPVLKELENLLEQGNLEKFYQQARSHLGQLKRSILEEDMPVDKLDRLLLIDRLVTVAPLFELNENTPFEDIREDNGDGHDIRHYKWNLMNDLYMISRLNLRQRQRTLFLKKETAHLCSLYAAMVIRSMKEAYIPDFESWKKEVMERKTAVWSKEFNARWESFLKERDERMERKKKELSIPFEQRMRRQKTEEERIRDREFGEKDAAFMREARKEWDKRRNLANVLGVMEGRNSGIEQFLRLRSGALLSILLNNYRGKASEVFKYLKMAGYEEGEMMEFIDREMGKNKDTEFLYQSMLGRKFLKEKKKE